MTVVEKNVREWAEELGLKDEYVNVGFKLGEQKGIEKGIEKGEEKGIENAYRSIIKSALENKYSIEEIIKLTGLSRAKILMIMKNSN